jgi:ribosomal protein L40E
LYSSSQIAISVAVWQIFVNLFIAIPLGIVLGLLYRTPTEAPSLEKEKIRTVQMVNCRHCNEDIPKGSEYCNKCGKKQ